MLHHNNAAPAHTSNIAMAAILECRFELLQHLLYFIDLTPTDFDVFQSCGQTFNTIKYVICVKKQWVKQLGEFSSWTALEVF